MSVADNDIWEPAAIAVAGGDTNTLNVRGTPATGIGGGATPAIPLLVTIAGATTLVEVPVDF